MTYPLIKSEDFKNNGFLEKEANTTAGIIDIMSQTVNKFAQEFAKSQVLNNVEGI